VVRCETRPICGRVPIHARRWRMHRHMCVCSH
jgi:hypothetical protein